LVGTDSKGEAHIHVLSFHIPKGKKVRRKTTKERNKAKEPTLERCTMSHLWLTKAERERESERKESKRVHVSLAKDNVFLLTL